MHRGLDSKTQINETHAEQGPDLGVGITLFFFFLFSLFKIKNLNLKKEKYYFPYADKRFYNIGTGTLIRYRR